MTFLVFDPACKKGDNHSFTPIVMLPQKRRTTAGQVSQTTPDARRSATLITTTVHATTCEKTLFLSRHSHANRSITTRHHRRRPRRPPYQNRDQRNRTTEDDGRMVHYLPPCRVGGNRRHILDSADTHTRTSERAECALCTGAGRFCAGTTSGP